MKVAVVGSGYVGLVAGACFADVGHDVICVDLNPQKIKDLEAGKIPIYEPGLDEIVHRNTKKGRLRFTTSYAEGMKDREVVFLAVGTPPGEDGSADLKYIRAACEDVARSATAPLIVVNKSTVPVGTQKKVTQWMKPFAKHAYEVVSNPEFLKEGAAIADFMKPDRVVVGAATEQAFDVMATLYAPFVRQGHPIVRMDPTSAELTKYACNSFLATRISFMNELALLCEKTGANIESIRQGMGSDVRIGPHFLYAGVGYGGSCFPKDVQALLKTSGEFGVALRIVQAAEDANAFQKTVLVERLTARLGSDLRGKKIAVWGLAFKPNTDDMREAPSIQIISRLHEMGAEVVGYDPVAKETAHEVLGDRLRYASSKEEAVMGADALLIVTEWNEFREVDFDWLKKNMKYPRIFDGRNLFHPKKVVDSGFEYWSIGRP